MDNRIVIDPNICHGKPVIRGTRVLVSNILSALASGETIEQVLDDFPNITKEDIYAALALGSELTKFEHTPYDIMAS